MGNLSRIGAPRLVAEFGCRHFVETGTGLGTGVHFATSLPFETIASCEINDDLGEATRALFLDDRRVEIHISGSLPMLTAVLPRIPAHSPILFWLDAHYPGADFADGHYDAEKDEGLRLPLKQELTLIQRLRPAGVDVILVDDLRIYEDGHYESPNLEPTHAAFPRDGRELEIVADLFGRTHAVSRSYQDEGYLILLPNARPQSPALAATLALVVQHAEAGRSADAGRLLEQAFRVHGGKPQAAAEIRTCAERALARSILVDPTHPVWLQLARDARAAGHTHVSIAGTGYHACLAWAAARSIGVGVAGFILLANEAPADQLGGLPVYSVDDALGTGLTGAIVACVDDIPDACVRLGSERRGSKLELFAPLTAQPDSSAHANNIANP